MKLGVKTKEKIARVIAEHFTPEEIVSVFVDANIQTDKSLREGWRIALDAFNKITVEEWIFNVLKKFCRLQNFEDRKVRRDFIDVLNKILLHEDLEIQCWDNKTVKIVWIDGRPNDIDLSKSAPPTKTSTYYVNEAIEFFKDECKKASISGLEYRYPLGENPERVIDIDDEDVHERASRIEAVEQLKKTGVITKYKIERGVKDDYAWDYVVCKIDESKVIEKGNIKVERQSYTNNNQKSEQSLITQKPDGYFFNNEKIRIKGEPEYFKIFEIVFSLIPKGGKKLYEDIIKIAKTLGLKNIDRGSIQRALTTKASYLYKNTGINFYGTGVTPLFAADPKGKFLRFNNKK